MEKSDYVKSSSLTPRWWNNDPRSPQTPIKQRGNNAYQSISDRRRTRSSVIFTLFTHHRLRVTLSVCVCVSAFVVKYSSLHINSSVLSVNG